MIILQSLILGMEVQFLGKKGHTFMWRPFPPPPIFSLSQRKYKSSELLVGYSSLLGFYLDLAKHLLR